MKSALITGVCGGVGQALAFRLREEGWAVYGTDIESCSPSLNLTGFWQGNIAEEVFWRCIKAFDCVDLYIIHIDIREGK